jgi:HAD superfamily hydrolase (TIGR01450 family)
VPLSPLLESYEQVLLDLDGCVWVGDECTRGAPEAVAALRTGGKALTFVTNDSRRSPEEYVRKLWSLGIQASLEEVVTVGSAIQHVLAEREPKTSVYVIGAEAIFRHVSDSGQRIVNGTSTASEAQIVVVAGHDDLRFSELRAAKMLAAGRDPLFQTSQGLWPGTGAIVAALEYATGRTAQAVGKPDPQMLYTALDRLGPGRTLMVGDRIQSDLAAAAAAGLDGAIVLTGVSTRGEAQDARDPAPVAIAEDLHSLVLGS